MIAAAWTCDAMWYCRTVAESTVDVLGLKIKAVAPDGAIKGHLGGVSGRGHVNGSQDIVPECFRTRLTSQSTHHYQFAAKPTMNCGEGEGGALFPTNGDRGGRRPRVGFTSNPSNAVGCTKSNRFLKGIERELVSFGDDRR
jgi:hypothetical protein